MTGLLRPQDLNMIAPDAEMEEIDHERSRKQKLKQQEKELREAFMSRKVARTRSIASTMRFTSQLRTASIISKSLHFRRATAATAEGGSISLMPSGKARSPASQKTPTNFAKRSYVRLDTSFGRRS
jgi:hypothetical protein